MAKNKHENQRKKWTAEENTQLLEIVDKWGFPKTQRDVRRLERTFKRGMKAASWIQHIKRVEKALRGPEESLEYAETPPSSVNYLPAEEEPVSEVSISTFCSDCVIKDKVIRDLVEYNRKLDQAIESCKNKSDALTMKVVSLTRELEKKEEQLETGCEDCQEPESCSLAEARLTYVLSKSFWYILTGTTVENWGELRNLVMASDPRKLPHSK